MRSDLIEMEKKFWTNDPEFYEANYTTDAVLVFQASARWTEPARLRERRGQAGRAALGRSPGTGSLLGPPTFAVRPC